MQVSEHERLRDAALLLAARRRYQDCKGAFITRRLSKTLRYAELCVDIIPGTYDRACMACINYYREINLLGVPIEVYMRHEGWSLVRCQKRRTNFHMWMDMDSRILMLGMPQRPKMGAGCHCLRLARSPMRRRLVVAWVLTERATE